MKKTATGPRLASPRCGNCGHTDPHELAAGGDVCTAKGHCLCEHYVAQFDQGVPGVTVWAPLGGLRERAPPFTLVIGPDVKVVRDHHERGWRELADRKRERNS